MDLGTTTILAASVGTVSTIAGLFLARRARRAREGARLLAESIASERDIPKSLHPVIDPDLCIGSLSCLKSCPEGDILGLVGSAAALVHADHCVGHGRCAAECPVGAIQLVFGTAKRGVDLPEVNEFFECSRPGVHVIGELGGMGLIRNAMLQGMECAGYVASALRQLPAQGVGIDVVIIGAGPAGIAAALKAKAEGLSYRLLDQSALGGTVAHYPRHKIVMTETIELPFYGKFGKPRISKRELLESFHKIVAKAELQVETGVKVSSIEGEDGAFEVVTDVAGRIPARKIMLAVGRRGTPRKLNVPGEESEKVVYSLDDPEQYRGRSVLVVGGGDAALEAAINLVEEGQAKVTLSYRGDALGRCRAANREKIDALAGSKRLAMALGTQVREVREREVSLQLKDKKVRLPNDYVVVCIGGELPVDFLQKAGVTMRRYFGEALGAPKKGEAPPPGKRAASFDPAAALERARRRFERRLAVALVVLGAAILAFLAWEGRDYYLLPQRARLASPLHRTMRSAGVWGHSVGIAATAFMLLNFVYFVRKRARFMTRWGGIRSWLHFHVFVGFMSPLVILFHAAFQSRNILATGTFASLCVVVATGVVGRYVYGLVPADGGRTPQLAELQAGFARLREQLEPAMALARDPARLHALFDHVSQPMAGGSFLFALATEPFRRAAARVQLLRVRRLFPERATYLELHAGYLRLERLRVQLAFYRSLKRLLGGWRLFHATLAIFLVLVIAAHIGLSLYLGYGLIHR